MGKILVFLRVSTEVQELDNQRIEMRDFVKSMGYKEDDIVYIEGKGASAIKINEEYLEMYNEVKKYIDNKEISAVAVWAVNRLARDEEFFVKFKKLFIENKVQFLVKNPTLVLLNPDGSVNAGNELALSLFSTMAKQEMEERKAKFRRTKTAMAKKGQWVGGRTKKFGYKVDENQFFVEDENDGSIVKIAFQLYSTGEYSNASLARELTERGYKRNDGLPINEHFLIRLIQSADYVGVPNEKNHMRIYPPLITKELYDKCREIAKGNQLTMRQGERIVLGAKLLKCKECGSMYTSNSRHFQCTAGAHDNCKDKLSIRQVVVDEILWRVAYTLHLEYLMNLSENMVATYMDEIKVIESKIATFTDKINGTEEKKQRVIDTYLEGLINKKIRDEKLSKIDAEDFAVQNEINTLKEKKLAIEGLISSANQDIEELELLNAMDILDAAENDKQAKYDIIHKHIIKVVPERMSFGKRDPRTTRDNGVLFSIYSVNGGVWKYLFIPKYYQKHNLYVWNGTDWSPDNIILYDNKYVRKSK